MRIWFLGFLALAMMILIAGSWFGCRGGSSSDDDDTAPLEEVPHTPTQILEDLTGYPWSLNEGDMNVATPEGWEFLFAIQLDNAHSFILNEGWSVDFGKVSNEFQKYGLSLAQSIDLSHIHNQVIFAKVEDMQGILRLRFATKLLFANEVMKLDPNAKSLGGAGSQGLGWYAAYYSTSPFGLITGEIAPCGSDDLTHATVTVTGASFFSRPDADGKFTIPDNQQDAADPQGLPAALFVESDSCLAVHATAMVDANLHEDPKCSVTGVPADCSNVVSMNFPDNTTVVGPVAIDLATEGVAPPPAQEGCVNCDFESGDTSGWESLSVGGTPTAAGCFGVTSAGHGDLFPDSPQSRYAYLTTGGDGLVSCAAYRTLVVPEGVTQLDIKYDLATQEYPLWVGSPYTDIFTVVVSHGFGFAVSRTVNNIATGADFTAIPSSVAAIAGIGQSADASFNADGQVFNGHLAWAPGTSLPRGGPSTNNLGAIATWPVTPGETITVLMTISDVGDPFFDTAALVDYIQFE